MNLSLVFTRILFSAMSVLFMLTYTMSSHDGDMFSKVAIGLGGGIALSGVLYCFEKLFSRFNLRAFNIAIVGLFIGFLMGHALVLTFKSIMSISAMSVTLSAVPAEMIKISLYLFGAYLGTLFTLKYSDEFYISIPFVRLTSSGTQRKDIILDTSILSDARLVDLASTHLLDGLLVVPKFVMKELYSQVETDNEMMRNKARRALDAVKKLEKLPKLGLRFSETNFSEVSDINQKTIRLARLIDGVILTADLTKLQLIQGEEVEFININTLSSCLKPVMQAGEKIQIKVQRFGKEPRQGVGYLDDGTMIVINNGGDYIGETISTQVISVKQTSAGRIIFTNAAESGSESIASSQPSETLKTATIAEH
ncbi:MAG: hypothetical protein S4CHLAM102_10160 [Chlamydiia bacterium]|nr:hypothetical protein [Chlamydiia bacterium]